MAKQAEAIAALGEILAVSFTSPTKVKAYLDLYPLPFAVACDPELAAYREFGMGRTSALRLLAPATIWGYLKGMAGGFWPRRPLADEDVMQLGGDFVLDARQRLVYAHPSHGATDRPTAAELLAALRRAASG